MKSSPLVALSLVAILAGCDKRSADEVSGQGQSTMVSSQVSHLDESKNNSFEITTVKSPQSGDLRLVNFSDDDHGWIGASDKVYKTTDGGKSWRPVNLALPDGSEVGQILFRSALSGWIVLKKDSGYVLDYPNLAQWLMHTSDGGETWQLQYQAKQVSALKVAFADEQNGWLSGIKYVSTKGVVYTHLVLRTTDGGQHWQDTSQNVARLTSDRKDAFGDPVNDGDMGIIPTGPLAANVITGSMRIAKTADGGESWKQTADLRDESDEQLGVRRFGISANRLWVAEATDGMEGIRCALTVEETENVWVKYTLAGVFFADAFSLSKDEFIACGYVKKFERAEDSYKMQKDASILYSPDSGRSWSVLYRNGTVKSVNALAVINRDNIWAVGENGALVHLTRLPRNRPTAP